MTKTTAIFIIFLFLILIIIINLDFVSSINCENLQAYYKLDANANDETGNYNGELFNYNTPISATYTTGKSNEALEINEYGIHMVQNNYLKFPFDFSLREYDDYDANFNSYRTYAFEVQGAIPYYLSAKTPITNNWQHIVGVINSATKKLYIYVDGELKNTISSNYEYSITVSAWVIPANIPYSMTGVIAGYISDSQDSWNDYGFSISSQKHTFFGKIDEVSVWNRALSNEEIQELYSNQVTCTPTLEYDLSIENINPIQVVENAGIGLKSNKNNRILFVEDKPAMARVKVDISENLEKYVKVKFEILEGDNITYTANQDKKIKQEYSVNEIKLGEDSFNFIIKSSDWVPKRNKTYKFRATIDPENEIYETNENNNKIISNEIQVGWVEKKPRFFGFSLMINFNGNTYSSNFDHGKQLIEKNIGYLQMTYPYQLTNTDFLDYQKVVIDYPKRVNDAEDMKALREYVAETIFMRYIQRAKLGKLYPGESIIPIVVVPREIMSSSDGYNYKGILMLSDSPFADNPTLVAHEYGHALGLYTGGNEQSEQFKPDGRLSSDGFCLKSDGTPCEFENILTGRRTNVWPENTGKPKVDMLSEFDNDLNNIGPRYHDIMSVVTSARAVWIHKETYDYLLAKLIKFKA